MTSKKNPLTWERVVQFIVLIVACLSTYFITVSKMNSRITAIETRIGDHDFGVMNQKITNIESTTNEFNRKFDNFSTAFNQFVGEYRASN